MLLHVWNGRHQYVLLQTRTFSYYLLVLILTASGGLAIGLPLPIAMHCPDMSQ